MSRTPRCKGLSPNQNQPNSWPLPVNRRPDNGTQMTKSRIPMTRLLARGPSAHLGTVDGTNPGRWVILDYFPGQAH